MADCSRKMKCDDPGFSPTEKYRREALLKQFCKLEGSSGNSAAYQNSPVWCEQCDNRFKFEGSDICAACAGLVA